MTHFIDIIGGRIAIRFAGTTERVAAPSVVVETEEVFFDDVDTAADALAVAMMSGGVTHTLCGQGVYDARFDLIAFGRLIEAKLVEAGMDLV